MPAPRKPNSWQPDNPHQHWPDRADVKDALSRAERPDEYLDCDDLARDIDIIGRSLNSVGGISTGIAVVSECWTRAMQNVSKMNEQCLVILYLTQTRRNVNIV